MKKMTKIISYVLLLGYLLILQNIVYSQAITTEKDRLRLAQKRQLEDYKYKTIDELQEINIGINKINVKDDSYIIAAVFYNQLEMLKLLVNNGANIYFKDDLGNLVNRYFYSYQHQQPNTKVLKFLLDHGVNPNSVGYFNDTPVVTAAIYNDFEAIKLLVKHGANIDAQLEETGMSALMYAVMLPDDQMTRFLIEHGANINITNIEGENLLVFAAYAGSLPNVKLSFR